jgi:hypothetical protein
VHGQEGENAVFSGGNPTGSIAFIDASAFCGGAGGSGTCSGSSTDVCTEIGTALTKLPATGGVIDARGVVPSVGGSQSCSGNPFASLPSNNNVPYWVLLPASNIKMYAGWVLPSNVHLLGEGQYTMLIAEFSSGDIIDMGSSGCTTPVTGISIDSVNLDAASTANSVNGIVNNCAQQSSYVNNVDMYSIGGVGILVTSNASNSGPYSNITFSGASSTSCPSHPAIGACPVCVDLEAQTRGVHGATCISGGNDNAPGAAGIYVNWSNNTVEDIHFEGFWDGIEVAENSSNTVGNVLISNITGAESGNGVTLNTVHICGPHPNSGEGACSAYGTVSDVTILSATDNNNGGAKGQASAVIQDDVTNTTVAAILPSDPSKISTGETVALYVLGEPMGGGYSRFTTNPGTNFTTSPSGSPVPTWGVGGTAPTGACSATSSNGSVPGAVYSDTAGGTNTSIYVCTSSGSWAPIL